MFLIADIEALVAKQCSVPQTVSSAILHFAVAANVSYGGLRRRILMGRWRSALGREPRPLRYCFVSMLHRIRGPQGAQFDKCSAMNKLGRSTESRHLLWRRRTLPPFVRSHSCCGEAAQSCHSPRLQITPEAKSCFAGRLGAQCKTHQSCTDEVLRSLRKRLRRVLLRRLPRHSRRCFLKF